MEWPNYASGTFGIDVHIGDKFTTLIFGLDLKMYYYSVCLESTDLN